MVKYLARDSNLLPNGGVDLYEGDRMDFSPTEQLRQSDTFDSFFVEGGTQSSQVIPFHAEDLEQKSHAYRMQAHDLCSSCGADTSSPNPESILL